MREPYDVVIVGYGPVGQSLSILLGMHGLKVCVIERWKTLYQLPRAVHYDHETARIFQHMGIGEQAAKQACSKISMRFLNKDRQLLMKQVSTGIGASGWPGSNMFYQPELEQLLNRRVGDFSNVERRLGWLVTDLATEGEGVTVHLRNTESDVMDRVRAKYVVGCDGSNSLVRRYVGEGVHDLNFYLPWLVVSGTVRKGELDGWGVQLCDPSRPQTYVPVGPHRVRFEFMLMPGETAEEMSTPAAAWALLEPWGFTHDNMILERHAVYTFAAKWSLNWRRGRLMLAGDAAHQTPPFLGQGMCSGIRDAMSLSWRLALVLQGKASETVLDKYTSERVPHIADIVGKAVEIGTVLCVTDPEAAKARDEAMLKQSSEISIVLTWRTGPGVFSPADPSAGLLSPQAVVRHEGRELLLDELSGTGFRVMTTLPETTVRSAQGFIGFESLGGRVVSFADAYGDVTGAFTAWLKNFGAVAILVRPDFQNFGMAKEAGELPRLFTLLDATLAQ